MPSMTNIMVQHKGDTFPIPTDLKLFLPIILLLNYFLLYLPIITPGNHPLFCEQKGMKLLLLVHLSE